MSTQIKKNRFENVRYAVTHPGQAHRDEFLSACILLALGVKEVYRRESQPEELEDPSVLIMDIGGSYDPDRNNFDHHQLPREADATCAFSMILKAIGVYDVMKDINPWVEFTEVLDSKGPMLAAKAVGCENFFAQILPALSPVEKALLNLFESNSEVSPDLKQIMQEIGESILKELETVLERFKILDDGAQFHQDGEIIDYRCVGKKNPGLGVMAWLKANKHNPAVSICHDDRGEGLTLYRFNDDPRYDFSQIASHWSVSFAHANGFIAKTKPSLTDEQIFELLELAKT